MPERVTSTFGSTNAVSRLSRLLSAALFIACVVGFHQLTESYGKFLLPQEGLTLIPERELAFYAYDTLIGGLAMWAAWSALAGLGLWHRIGDACAQLARERPQALCFVLAALMFAASASFRLLVLDGQPVADDEATYLFIARTLLTGHVVNPAPVDPEFFRNQFVVLDAHAWYGKYPIGHPLCLALAEWLHCRDFIMPLMAASCVPLCWALGRRFFSERAALLGCMLLLLSPHFVWTAGTLLSQPTACSTLLAGVWLVLCAKEQRRVVLALSAGALLGFGVLVRPLPGALFAAVVCMWAAADAWQTAAGRERRHAWLRASVIGLGCAAGAGAVLAVNQLQTGSAFSSGYHEVHGGVQVFANAHADLAHSLFGALLRENVWLLGVPCSLLPCWFSRPARQGALFWGLLLAELSYRLISSKTVVASTGPIYLTEIVPLLTLAVADGLLNLHARARARHDLLPLMAAGVLVACCLFVPIQWRTLRRGVEVRSLVFRMLEQTHADQALVFSDALVQPESSYSWAYFPDNPSPDLRDPVLFVRVPKQDTTRTAHEFWQRRFPRRRAFFYLWSSSGEPDFQELVR